MNILRQYQIPLITSVLALLFIVVPHFAFASVESFFQTVLWDVLVGITSIILRIGAIIFDYGVNTFVIQFAGMYLNSGVGTAVDKVWFVIRDFVNMLFIFGLVYIGFKMILDSDSSNTKRWLANLIMAAIFINFSLFATKLVIDFSNQLATQVAISGLGAEPTTNEWGATHEVDLATYILDSMGIKDILNFDIEKVTNGGSGGWGYIFGTAIFFTITGFVLAAGGILLMIRFVVLTLFLILSPFMFVSWILPPVQDTMHKYWKIFLGRAFFAPIYFIFIYFSLETINALQQSIGLSNRAGNWAQTFQSSTGEKAIEATESTLPFFFIICAFMIASLVAASKLGAEGADKAIGMGKSIQNRASNYAKRGAVNTGRFAGRAAGGVAARGVNDIAASARSRYNNLAIRAQNSTSVRGRVANRLLRGTDGMTQKVLAAGEGASVLGSETRSQQTARRDAYRKRNNDNQGVNERAAAVTNNRVPRITSTSSAEEIAAAQHARRVAGSNIRDMRPEELLDFIRDNQSAAENYRIRAATGEYNEADLADMRAEFTDVTSPEFLSLLTDAQVAAYEQSGMLTQTQIDENRQQRDDGIFDEIIATLNNSNATAEQLEEATEQLARATANLSPERLGNMVRRTADGGLNGHSWVLNPAIASKLTDANLNTLKDNGVVNLNEHRVIREARDAGISHVALHGTLASQNVIAARTAAGDADFQRNRERTQRRMFKSPSEAGKLPASVLSQPAVAQHLTPQIIEEFLKNVSPVDPGINDVRRNIQTHVNGNGAGTTRAAWENWSEKTTLGRQFELSFGTVNP